MRSTGLLVRGCFVAAAACVIVSGVSWWMRQRAYARSLPIANASPLVYNGPAPVSKQLSKTLSDYHATDRERALFRKFTQAEEKSDSGSMRTILRSMAKSFENAGEHEMAVEINEKARDLSVSKGRKMDAAQSLQDIADVYQKAGRLADAAEYGEQAAEEYDRIDARKQLDLTLRRLCENYRGLARYEDARACLEKANRVVASMKKEIRSKAKDLARKVKPKLPHDAQDDNEDNDAKEPDVEIEDEPADTGGEAT